jgi:pyruvate dehydrogenase E2 component (dihydrolipoamide acetyltransferase)
MAGDHDERIQAITMPKWGLSMTTGKIVEIHVAEGDTLAKGDDVLDIDTDKIAGTLESSVAGPIRRLVVGVGDELPVGAVLAVVAPAEVPDAEIDAVVEAARAAAESGELDVPDEPQPQLVEIHGRTISYLTLAPEEPSGAPVVLVHGFGGDKNSWLFVQQPLSEEHAVHAVDLPGHGASGRDVGDGSLAGLADVLVGFLDALGISRVHLVGHSLGGAVVAAAARSVPEKVASLTLLAPVGYGPDADAEYLRGFAAAVSRRELKPLVGRLFADPSLVTRQLVGRPAALQAARRGGQGPVRAARHAARRRPAGDRHAGAARRRRRAGDRDVGLGGRHPAATGGHRGAGGGRAHAAHGGGERRGPGAAGARGRMTPA